MSHEGYLAQPVHAYWDDFWALRGIGDAAYLARVLGDTGQERRLVALRDALGTCLYASIEMTIAQRGLDYVPGSVEWADFDVTATATALTTTDAAERLPPAALAFTYDEYLRGFRKRRDGEIDWNNYTAYEIRIWAPWCGSAASTRRTSCSTSFSPTGGRAPGTSGPRSPGAIRAAPVISATCRTPGSAPSGCSRC